jgi:hypothetical protein
MRSRDNETSDFLLIGPSTCRHETPGRGRDPACDLDGPAFRRWYAREFGFEGAAPARFASELASARRIDPAELHDNNQVLTACQQSVEPCLQEFRRLLAGTREEPVRLFDLANYRLKVMNESALAPEETAWRDFALCWRQTGEYEDEWRLEAGLVHSQLTVLTRERRCQMTWWERETSVMNRAALETIFQRQCARLDKLASRDIPTLISEVVRDWLREVSRLFPTIYQHAQDRTPHLYQNPMWEHYWHAMGEEEKSAAIRARNRHPLSRRWMGEDLRRFAPRPFDGPAPEDAPDAPPPPPE